MVRMTDYAELHCLSDFSFQRGASSARELFERASECGYAALAITDECSLAGIVRAWEASRDTGVPLIVGTEIQLADGPKLVLLAENKQGYVSLCRLITQGRRASEKGSYHLTRADMAEGAPGTLVLWIPEREPDREHGAWVKHLFDDRAWLAVELHRDVDDDARLAELEALGESLQLPRVASGDVHMHIRRCLPLQHTMTAIRHRMTIAKAGAVLFRNGERHLRRRSILEKIYPKALLDENVRIAKRCTFSLKDDLRYQYPKELVPDGCTAIQWLRQLVAEGAAWRWPNGVPSEFQSKIEQKFSAKGAARPPIPSCALHWASRMPTPRKSICWSSDSFPSNVTSRPISMSTSSMSVVRKSSNTSIKNTGVNARRLPRRLSVTDPKAQCAT
jgi:error-prone DNA polymerase